MADTLVETGLYNTTDFCGFCGGPYWISPTEAVVFSVSNGSDVEAYYTDDGGVTWTDSQPEAGTIRRLATYFDQETPGDTGTLVHVVWLDTADNEFKYCYFDVSTGAWSASVRTIVSGLTVDAGPASNRCDVTKTVSGNIIATYRTPTETGGYKTADAFATAGTSIANPYESGAADMVKLYPAATADNNDAAAIFHDIDANALSVKVYDDSADSWNNEVAITTAAGDGSRYQFDAAVRHSDGAILVAVHNSFDNAADDLETWEVVPDDTSPTVTQKTNIFSNQSECGLVGVCINQQNDDVYVAYAKGGTYLSLTDIVYHKSTDDMANWGSETLYNDDTEDDYRQITTPRSIGNDGGNVQWGWYDDDTIDLYVNLVNDVAISAAVAGGGWTHIFTGVSAANMSKIDGVAKASISKVTGV